MPNVKIIVAKTFVSMLATGDDGSLPCQRSHLLVPSLPSLLFLLLSGYLSGQDAEEDAKIAIETLKNDSVRIPALASAMTKTGFRPKRAYRGANSHIYPYLYI